MIYSTRLVPASLRTGYRVVPCKCIVVIYSYIAAAIALWNAIANSKIDEANPATIFFDSSFTVSPTSIKICVSLTGISVFRRLRFDVVPLPKLEV